MVAISLNEGISVVKLYRVKPTDKASHGGHFKYQTEPKCGSGIGRFQVYQTDNANARAIGRRPKWTVCDLYANVMDPRARRECETLAEVREWIEKRERE